MMTTLKRTRKRARDSGYSSSSLEAYELDADESQDASREILPPTDDPVRMYLKEIGQVPLLDSNREIWLSTQIAAERHLEVLRDELMSLDNQSSKRQEPDYLDVERFAYRRLRQDWDRLQTAAEERNVDMPDFFKLLGEVQETILNWDREAESYIRRYLGQKNWGKTKAGRSWHKSFLR